MQTMKYQERFLILVILMLKWLVIACEHQEVCSTKDLIVNCDDNEAILVEKALFGRMRIGKCVHKNFGYLGCENNVLGLVDKWCSGLQHCTVEVTNEDLDKANRACDPDLNSYLDVDYTCIPVTQPNGLCSQSQSPVAVRNSQGHLSSQVTTETGCGSPKAPWVIEAQSGQTIDLRLIDFGASSRTDQSLYTNCHEVYGFVVERDLGVNMTICGGTERRKHLYKSKTNKVEVQMLPHRTSSSSRYFVQYSLIGCADLTPPANAWYKREGNEAAIGCKSNSKVWHLHCDGNAWTGVVGNCSKNGITQQGTISSLDISFSTVIILTGVVCGALLLVIIVVVAGVVYVRKQSIKHELKLRSEYGFSPNATYYTMKPGYDISTMAGSDVKHPVESQTLIRLGDKDSVTSERRQAELANATTVRPFVSHQLKAMGEGDSGGNLI